MQFDADLTIVNESSSKSVYAFSLTPLPPDCAEKCFSEIS
jgi:hypothetical protein